MAPIAVHDSPSAPSWFTPKRLLIILCVINMLNYVDQGAVASNGVNGTIETCDESGICTSGTGIQGDFDLNNFQDGILSSAFIVGLLLASPIFASLAKSHNPFSLIGFGLFVWTLAAAGCGCSIDFWSITICRMLVGVAQASIVSLAPPFIDDNAPATQKTFWLATFFMCIPTGVALGYVYGGIVGDYFSWRYAFWGESLLMLPFAIFGFAMKPLQLRENDNEGINGQGVKASKLKDSTTTLHQLSRFLEDVKMLLLHKVFLINVLGYASYYFVIGAYSYWGPKAGHSIYHMGNTDLMFGGVTIVCGIFGTLGGGLILDHMDATISNAFKLLSGVTFLGAIFCFSAFFLSNLYGFLFLFSVGELFVFAAQAPVNYVFLHCVKPGMRPLSMAVSTIFFHMLGDLPSSPLVGILEDHINNWRVTMLILTAVFFLTAGIWFTGVFVKSVDMFNEDDASGIGKDSTEPLLEENKGENEISENA